MTHADLIARLERERVSYPDLLEAERYQPGAVERLAGRPARYTPITEERAAANRARLKAAINERRKP